MTDEADKKPWHPNFFECICADGLGPEPGRKYEGRLPKEFVDPQYVRYVSHLWELVIDPFAEWPATEGPRMVSDGPAIPFTSKEARELFWLLEEQERRTRLKLRSVK